MAKKLVWEFQLKDSMSGPANAEAAALGKLKLVLEGAGRSTEHFGEQAEKASHHGETFATTLHSAIGVAEQLGELGLRAAEGIAEIGIEFGKTAVEAASFKESTLISLETVLGSAKEAKGLFGDTIALAAHLPIETKAAIEAANQLALTGFNRKEIAPLTVAASDVGALNPGRGSEAMRLFLRQIADIKSVGLSSRHLLALSQETHLPEEKILANLSKMTGLKGTPEQLKKMLGSIDKDTAIAAIAQTVADVEGGALGNLSKKLSTTTEGLLSTLKSRKLELLMDLDESPAYAEFRSFLGNAANLLDPSSEFGGRVKSKIATTFGNVFHTVFGDFAGDAGVGRLEHVLDEVAKGAELVGVGLEGSAEFAKAFADELLDASGIGGDLFGPDGSLDKKKVKEITDEFRDFGHELGIVANGLIEAAKGAKTLVDTLSVHGDIGVWLADKRMRDQGLEGRAYDPMHPELGGNDLRELGSKGLRDWNDKQAAMRTALDGQNALATLNVRAQVPAGLLGQRVGSPSVVTNINVHAPGAAPGAGKEIAKEVERVAVDPMKVSARNARLTPGS
jgi:hypothetical protein